MFDGHNTCSLERKNEIWAIGHFEISNIRLDSEAVKTKTIEACWNECEKYLQIIHSPLSLSSKPLFQAEF